MSRIDDVIREHCPDGVVFRDLGEVAAYSHTRVDSAEIDATTFVGVDNLLPNAGGRVDASYPPNTARLTAFEPGDTLLGNIRPYLKKAWLADRAGGCSGDVLAVRVRQEFRALLSPRFVHYVLTTDDFFRFDMRHAKGAKMPRGSKDAILRYRIPMPPPAIQREIIAILDRMNRLQSRLEAELECRSRQYAYYRDLLFSFSDGVDWSPLGHVGRFFRGKRFTKADYVDEGIPAIHYGEIYTAFGTATDTVISHVRPDLGQSLRFASPGDVVLVDVGETVEDVGKAVAWLGNGDVAIHDHCYAFRHDLNPSFVSYYMQTARFHREKAKHVARTKVKTLLMDGLAKVSIPVPPLEEQERIVGILAKFDALVNDLSIGLPAEIRARRTQYEYYRDKLLTFEERVA